jgi:LPS-assembly protein
MALSAGIRRSYLRRRVKKGALMLLGAAAFAAGCAFDAAPALAQRSQAQQPQAQNLLRFPTRPTRRKPVAAPPRQTDKTPMLLQATEIHYDYSNKRVSAVGNVQIYYAGSTLEADKVTYDETTKRMHAEGNVRLTEADGRITHADVLNLSDDFRDGFVDSLRLDTPDRTRMAAARAERSDGNFTVLHSGVYTACEPCKDDPKKPPLWQIKAARMIHDKGEKMIYFEDARLEFFGKPLAYMPYFAAPDPSVKRKSGFLMPTTSYSVKYGVGIEVPYYWALAPDYDITFLPRLMTRQGALMRSEWRQRLVNGAYSIRASGIYQLDKDYFRRDDGSATPGYRDWRGSLETSGQFAITDKWVWGWDGVVPSDKTFFQDYGLSTYQRDANSIRARLTEGTSQLYVSGRGNRSYFDARGIYYYGFSEADSQRQIPVIHPLVDYSYTFGQPVLGGELGYRTNLTSLSRDSAVLNPITSAAAADPTVCVPTSADPTIKSKCLLRGVAGTYSRVSAEAQWKRSIIDSYGQIFTPFAMVRADAATMSINSDPAVANFTATGDNIEFRAMPTVGVEYRFPFINVQSWGTQTVEPIAQIIVRPNEPRIGKLPNEDSQSLIFDDSNLFRIDKFSGWDRVEGGTRANVGVQYTAQFNRGGFVNALFGQSYQMFGTNSFAVSDGSNAGLDSGLDTSRSDYVARLSYQPDRTYTFTTRYRFDNDTFALRRFEVEGRANYDRWSVGALYGSYDIQPQLGFLRRREGILGNASVKLSNNWVVSAALRYDIDAAKVDATQFGIGYIDDCLIVALNYMTSYTYSGNPTKDQRVLLQVSLRTLGGTAVSQTISSTPIEP